MFIKVAELRTGKYFEDKGNAVYFIRNQSLFEYSLENKMLIELLQGVYNFFCFDHYVLAGKVGNEKSILYDIKSGFSEEFPFDLNIPGVKSETGYYGSTIYNGKPSILFFSFLTKRLECVYETKYGIAGVVHDGKYLSVSSNVLYCYSLDDSHNAVWQHNFLQHARTPVLTPFPVRRQLKLINNTVCTGISFDTESYLCGLDFYTGEVKWKYTLRSSFNVYGDTVYSFASADNQFILSVIKADTGDVKYIELTSAINIKSNEKSKFYESFDFFVQEDFLYYSFHSSGDIGVIDLKSLQEVWHDSIQINSENWQIGAPLVFGKSLYIACEDTTLLVYDRTG